MAAKSFTKALQRSLDVFKEETSRVMRMETSPTATSEGPLHLYSLTHPSHISNFATGSDSDIGGLTTCKLSLDDQEGKGRFFGTITNQVPRGAKIEKSGYAGMRNKNRPTLFGSQTWDTTLYPYLALRVRNRLAGPSTSSSNSQSSSSSPSTSTFTPSSSSSSSSLNAALHESAPTNSPPITRAVHALGLGRKEPVGPKYFVNIQTDGPVTSDLFQHRLWLGEEEGGEWQTVVIPFDDFVLTNTGQLSNSQITMMREKVRTVGISVVLDAPTLPSSVSNTSSTTSSSSSSNSSSSSTSSTPSALKKSPAEELDSDDWGRDGNFMDKGKENGKEERVGLGPERGSKKGRSFNFDLGVESVWAVGRPEGE